MSKPRIWKTYLGARWHGCRIMRAVCGDYHDDTGSYWQIQNAKEHPKKGACGQEWFCLVRDYNEHYQSFPLLCGDPYYFAKGIKKCLGFLHWKQYEPPKTYGRNRAAVERVYETRYDGRPVPACGRLRSA